jgi:cytochrome c oxidase subunit 3
MDAIAGQTRQRDIGAYVGMVVFLAAWGMCFAGLFFAYAVIRSSAASWPPSGTDPLPVGLPAANTLLLLLSSYLVHRAEAAARLGRPLLGWLAGTAVLGGLFLGLQTLVWTRLYAGGLRPDSGVFGSVFYALTVFHALHVLTALAWIGYLVPGVLGGKYGPARHNAVRTCAMFWHFVDGIWVVMFFSVYVF